MRELLDAGVHFGHQTRRWNPKMRRYIHGERSGIYVIDLIQTQQQLAEACNFVGGIAQRGGNILFVGTKKQSQDAVEEHAKRANMPYINHRWLGGVLTNWKTISNRISYLLELRRQLETGQLDLLGKKEQQVRLNEKKKLEFSLGGLAGSEGLPDAVVIVDLVAEHIAVREARRLKLPIIALVDTNCDPDEADYVVAGNDDAMRSCDLFLRVLADAILDAKGAAARISEEEFAAEQSEAQAEPVAVGVGAGEASSSEGA
jgi:small subunit ribosomal protein S2